MPIRFPDLKMLLKKYKWGFESHSIEDGTIAARKHLFSRIRRAGRGTSSGAEEHRDSPKTMDNDVRNTEYCIGFSTAITRAIGTAITFTPCRYSSAA
jgi:hypothetical protein